MTLLASNHANKIPIQCTNVNLSAISNNIARLSYLKTGACLALEKIITVELKKQFDIPETANAKVLGCRSAVYENNKGNIVAFIIAGHGFAGEEACEQALISVGKNSKVVPEVYNLEYIDLTIFNKTYKVCVIEMEKYKPLSLSETKFFDKHIIDFYHPGSLELMKTQEGVPAAEIAIMDKMIDLRDRMKAENIHHSDMSPYNVAWDADGNLRLLDWESIIFDAA